MLTHRVFISLSHRQMHTNTAHTHHQCYVILLSHCGSSSEQLGHEPGSTHTVILSLHITRYQLALISWRLKAGPSIRFHHLHYGGTVPTVSPQCSQQTWGPTLYLKQEQWLSGNHYVSISAHQMPDKLTSESHDTGQTCSRLPWCPRMHTLR